MLVLNRKSGQKILIYPTTTRNLDMSVRELFSGGAIEILICRAKGFNKNVKIGIIAPKQLCVLREETQGLSFNLETKSESG